MKNGGITRQVLKCNGRQLIKLNHADSAVDQGTQFLDPVSLANISHRPQIPTGDRRER